MATERKRKPRPQAPVAQEAAPELAVSVAVERSIGTATGFDRELAELRRFLEYRTAQFLVSRGLKGSWKLIVYVSREPVK